MAKYSLNNCIDRLASGLISEWIIPELGYNDICLLPKRVSVESRSQCDVSCQIGKRKFALPLIAANMKSVIDEETCVFLANNNLFYIMHRFGINQVDFIKNMNSKNLYSSISIGINQDSYDDLHNIKREGLNVDYITIDVANAWCDKTKQMISFIKDNFNDTCLIVGNVASSDACCEIKSWGADIIKVGIAEGKSCITKNKTGFSRPMVSTILDCTISNIPIIADGGIREHGDVAKAIACGADYVMAGSLFSGYDQSAGDVIQTNQGKFKEYYGNASEFTKGERKHVEGRKVLEPYKGDMNNFIKEITEDLKSSVSYSGGRDLSDLKQIGYDSILVLK